MDLFDWQDEAACIGTPTSWWFPASPDEIDARAAAKCQTCPVRSQCHRHALRHEAHGTWAGTTEARRAALRKAAGLRTFDERDPVVVDRLAAMHANGATPPPDR